ncbi:MAG: hypothetical protein WCH39_21455 [Schlesneria sp.]
MPINSPDAVIAVFELQPYWGPELQRQFQADNVAVTECRSVNDLFPIVDSFTKGLIVIDLDVAITDCLAWLGTEVAKHPVRVPIIAIGSAATADLEWGLREAGVTAFLPELMARPDFARLCRRLLS